MLLKVTIKKKGKGEVIYRLPLHMNMRKKILTLLLSAALITGIVANSVQGSAKALVSESAKTETATVNGRSVMVGDPEADRHLYSQEDSDDTMNILNGRSLKSASRSANPYTGIKYTHSNTYTGMNIYNGIDVSYYQPTIDWNKVKADGIEFVFVRVGYRGYGAAGTLAADLCFEKHVEGALAAGLKVGLYYYTEAINTSEAKEEAQYCIEKAKNYDITLPIVYDYETTTVGGVKTGRKYKAKLSKSAATKNCTAFCDTIKAAGYTPMVYANKSDLSTLIDGAALEKNYKIWLANYTSQTTYTGKYEFWQYTSSGKIDGISGKVDCNFWYASEDMDENPDAVTIENAQFASVASKAYTGKAITPAPKLTLDGKTLKKGTNYNLVYSENTEVGMATITAVGTGNYKGRVSTTFKIIPPKVTSFKGVSGTKKITLSWAKNDQATKYQIYRKATYNGKTYTKVKAVAGTKTTWENTSLKADKEYFYRIRAYKIVDGVKYYSGYTYLTVSTLPGGKKATVNTATKLYETPGLSGNEVASIPKSAKITYVGRTYFKSTAIVYHIKYSKGTKTLEGYIPSTVKLKF